MSVRDDLKARAFGVLLSEDDNPPVITPTVRLSDALSAIEQSQSAFEARGDRIAELEQFVTGVQAEFPQTEGCDLQATLDGLAAAVEADNDILRQRDELERENARRERDLEELERENDDYDGALKAAMRDCGSEQERRVAAQEAITQYYVPLLSQARELLNQVDRYKQQILAQEGCVTGFAANLIDLIDETRTILTGEPKDATALRERQDGANVEAS